MVINIIERLFYQLVVTTPSLILNTIYRNTNTVHIKKQIAENNIVMFYSEKPDISESIKTIVGVKNV